MSWWLQTLVVVSIMAAVCVLFGWLEGKWNASGDFKPLADGKPWCATAIQHYDHIHVYNSASNQIEQEVLKKLIADNPGGAMIIPQGVEVEFIPMEQGVRNPFVDEMDWFFEEEYGKPE